MSDRPILFSAPMIRALLEGRKTQTRQTLKFQPAPGISIVRKTIRPLNADPYHSFERRSMYGNYAGELDIKIKRGDCLWVREAWHAARSLNNTPPRDIPLDADIEYAATARSYAEIGLKGKLRPSMFMPRWASRLTLIVTDVRVERLQDIGEADAIAEGIERHKSGWMPYSTAFYDGDGLTPANYHTDPRISYMQLWNSINGHGAWDDNPWIAAYTFHCIHKNIDQIEGQP